MPIRRRLAKYQPPKKQDVQYQQISHDLAEKTKKIEREGAVMEMWFFWPLYALFKLILGEIPSIHWQIFLLISLFK